MSTSNERTRLQPTPLQTLANHKRGAQRQRVTTRSHAHPILAPLDHPAGDPILPIRHRELVERQHDARARTRREVLDFCKRAKHPPRMGHLGRRRHRHVQLRDLGPGDRARVGHREGGGQVKVVVGDDRRGELEAGERKGGVGETVSASTSTARPTDSE